ncbi:MAG: SiaB family protein kinase [Cyclobacteriaceae bacterium]
MDYLKQYKSLFDSNILLLYKGKINFNIVMAIIEILETGVEEIEEDRALKRKFYASATESLQNMVNHMKPVESSSYDFFESNSGMIMVVVRGRYYKIVTGNYISNEHKDSLSNKIDLINRLEPGQLKALYKRILSESHMDDSGNAGLGLVDMARKTGQKLRYSMSAIDEHYSYFNFEIKIPKESSTRRVYA